VRSLEEQATTRRFLFIARHEAQFPVALMSRWLGVSRSGYYAWRARGPSQRRREDEALLARIRDTDARLGGGASGARMHESLRGEGLRISRRRVLRLMREGGVRRRTKKGAG